MNPSNALLLEMALNDSGVLSEDGIPIMFRRYQGRVQITSTLESLGDEEWNELEEW